MTDVDIAALADLLKAASGVYVTFPISPKHIKGQHLSDPERLAIAAALWEVVQLREHVPPELNVVSVIEARQSRILELETDLAAAVEREREEIVQRIEHMRASRPAIDSPYNCGVIVGLQNVIAAIRAKGKGKGT